MSRPHDLKQMSTLARCVALAVGLAEIPLQVFLYRQYRDVVDGQAVLANVAVLFYGLVAIVAVWSVDKLFRVWRSQHR